MSTGDTLLQLGVGGIFAIMVIKLVFDFLQRKMNGFAYDGKKRPSTGPKPIPVAINVDGVTDRLDRIIDRLDELMAIAKLTRKQAELNGEQTERQQRSFNDVLTRIETAVQRRSTGPIEPA